MYTIFDTERAGSSRSHMHISSTPGEGRRHPIRSQQQPAANIHLTCTSPAHLSQSFRQPYQRPSNHTVPTYLLTSHQQPRRRHISAPTPPSSLHPTSASIERHQAVISSTTARAREDSSRCRRRCRSVSSRRRNACRTSPCLVSPPSHMTTTPATST